MDAADVDLAGQAGSVELVELVELVEDVEHVILGAGAGGVTAGGAGTGVGDVAEVMAAARRTERVVTVLGGAVSSVRDALAGYVAARGGTVDEVRRVSVVVVVVGEAAGAVDSAYAAGTAGAADGRDAGAGSEGGGVRRVVVGDLRVLAEALNARWDEQWCATRQFCC